ncbi:immunoglobulin-like domain-containing protein [Chryseobacterium taklimakanense]|uniref:immunoglobulin-like domain-containing protein n=1 Tax=Chryseobacterium taklimakanense TaxID=536441 RepID=UPI003742C8C2
MTTGDKFYLEKWNGKSWTAVRSDTKRIFTDIGYEIAPGESREFETDIIGYYTNLQTGRYRFSKKYNFDKDIPITQDEIYWIYTEFTVE